MSYVRFLVEQPVLYDWVGSFGPADEGVVAVVAIEYSISVTPTRALIGEPITAILRCIAPSDAPGSLTFDHRSLVIELDRHGLSEPALVFPNRYAVERGGNLLRLASSGGVADLAPGEECTRKFELGELFPEPVLSAGAFSVTYRLEEAEPLVRPAPVVVQVDSGPDAVLQLIGRLAADSSALRFRAAELLTSMTAQDFGYAADAPVETQRDAVLRWQTWWQREGVQLPWNFESEGATFGKVLFDAPSSRRSSRLGGVAYPGVHG
jgi:hypothetical protein